MTTVSQSINSHVASASRSCTARKIAQVPAISTSHIRACDRHHGNRSLRVFRNSRCQRLDAQTHLVSAGQVATQTATRFSRQDAESVRRSLQTLTEAILTDPLTQYLSPSSGGEVNADDLRNHIKDQLDGANAADLLFQVDDFAAAAWCYKIPEELPLKEVSQEPAAVSDSTVNDKFTELGKALSEQLVEFLLAHGSCIKISYIGTLPTMQGQGLGGRLLKQINKVADAEQQWVYLEASSERGTHLYLRHGFQMLKEDKMRPDAPTIYYMGRPPKPDVPSDV